MTGLLIVALLAGAASVLTPCVLPLLPAVFVVSADADRSRIIGIVTGIITSFAIAMLVLSSAISALNLPANTLRYLSAGMLLIFGLILVIPQLEERFQRTMSALVSRAPQGSRVRTGFTGGLVAGASLGLVWAPCAGPIFAAISVAAATESIGTRTIAVTIAYCIGMAIPLTAIVVGGRSAAAWIRSRVGSGRALQASMGVILIATGVLIGSGAETSVNKWLAAHIGFSSTPIASLEKRAVNGSTTSVRASADGAKRTTFSRGELQANGYPEPTGEGLVNYGPAPDFAKITTWYNTPGGKPLTLKQLRGKVVLVDFWTYSCINCLRSLPHVQALDRAYRDKGLVVVGVHTPEFQFEGDPGNVGKAVRDLKVTYPVALDATYGTWEQYFNRYWPAHYLIDRDGNIRSVHYGEGDYDLTDQYVRKLLALPATGAGSATAMPADRIQAQTPETYFGSDRAERMVGGVDGADGMVDTGRAASYRSPTTAAKGLDADEWGFNGTWTVLGDRAVAGSGAKLSIHYRAAKVFTVLGLAPGAKPAAMTIHDGDATRTVMVDTNKLYTLRDRDTYSEGVLTFDVPPGVEAYTYTFG